MKMKRKKKLGGKTSWHIHETHVARCIVSKKSYVWPKVQMHTVSIHEAVIGELVNLPFW